MVNSALNCAKLRSDECGEASWSRMNRAMIPER